ncbi:hypothetical protein [Salibacterium aidingense]|uniref:hypothetical protein n=1 Tax=Salibacterium aidingense TaxID=384933 RepID=UPI000414C347|nr:hypothetical protein [Salibacterium aidingense]
MDKGAEQVMENLPDLDREVYLFMQEQYDELEEAGEKHDVAANDTFVEKKASEKFNISEEEAGNIYAKTESQLSRVQQKRASK